MPVVDTIYEYQDERGRPGRCRIRVYHLASGMTVVIASELADNPGASVTDQAERLATAIRARFVEPGGAMVWIEHYPALEKLEESEEFERVLFRWDGQGYEEPQWRPSSRDQVEALIGEVLE